MKNVGYMYWYIVQLHVHYIVQYVHTCTCTGTTGNKQLKQPLNFNFDSFLNCHLCTCSILQQSDIRQLYNIMLSKGFNIRKGENSHLDVVIYKFTSQLHVFFTSYFFFK